MWQSGGHFVSVSIVSATFQNESVARRTFFHNHHSRDGVVKLIAALLQTSQRAPRFLNGSRGRLPQETKRDFVPLGDSPPPRRYRGNLRNCLEDPKRCGLFGSERPVIDADVFNVAVEAVLQALAGTDAKWYLIVERPYHRVEKNLGMLHLTVGVNPDDVSLACAA